MNLGVIIGHHLTQRQSWFILVDQNSTLLHSRERPSLDEELYGYNARRLKGHTDDLVKEVGWKPDRGSKIPEVKRPQCLSQEGSYRIPSVVGTRGCN